MRKPQAKQNLKEDQILKKVDPIITDVFDLENYTPQGFSFRKAISFVVFYRLEFG